MIIFPAMAIAEEAQTDPTAEPAKEIVQVQEQVEQVEVQEPVEEQKTAPEKSMKIFYIFGAVLVILAIVV